MFLIMINLVGHHFWAISQQKKRVKNLPHDNGYVSSLIQKNNIFKNSWKQHPRALQFRHISTQKSRSWHINIPSLIQHNKKKLRGTADIKYANAIGLFD